MKPLFTLFWQLCRFQRGPQDVPHSPPLLAFLVILLLLLSGAMVLVFEPTYMTEKLMGSAAALAAWFALVFLLLKFKGLGNRFAQTMTACIGTDLVINVLSLPFQAAIVNLPAESGVGAVGRFGLLALMIWDILVKGHIYAYSMNMGRLQGNFLAICMWLAILLISFRFLPEAVQNAQ